MKRLNVSDVKPVVVKEPPRAATASSRFRETVPMLFGISICSRTPVFLEQELGAQHMAYLPACADKVPGDATKSVIIPALAAHKRTYEHQRSITFLRDSRKSDR